MVEVVVAAVAEGMLEYTLDVVKLEPGDRKCSTKEMPTENRSNFCTVFKSTNNRRGKQRASCFVFFAQNVTALTCETD